MIVLVSIFVLVVLSLLPFSMVYGTTIYSNTTSLSDEYYNDTARLANTAKQQELADDLKDQFEKEKEMERETFYFDKKFLDIYEKCSIANTTSETWTMCNSIIEEYNNNMRNLFLKHNESIEQILYGKPG